MNLSLFRGIDVVDEPEVLSESTVYVVGLRYNKWLAVFLCPCGCHSVIKLNMLKDCRPCWSVRIHKKSNVTIKPSVWRIEGCRSHFTVRKGEIAWVNDLDNWNDFDQNPYHF